MKNKGVENFQTFCVLYLLTTYGATLFLQR